MRTLALVLLICVLSTTGLPGELQSPETMFSVTLDPVENGSISIEPKLPDDRKVKPGTVLKVTATPASGYAFDGGYYAQPGMWGKMFYESMTPTFEVTVNQNKSIGASFIEEKALEGFSVKQDIVYAQPGVKKLKYDVFSPKGAKDLPIIVIIHGGGWVANTEDIMRGLARELVRGGDYVVCSMDYRWMGNRDGDKGMNMMVNLIEDVFGGLAHIQEHAKQYGADGSRIAVTGDSAGGHLSAVASLMPDMIGDGGFGSKAGVYEFKPSYVPAGKTVADVRKELRHELRPELVRLMKDPDLRKRVNVARSTLPAITHVDMSARVQTVDEERHGRFYRLMNEFKRLTGCSVIINTSFNIRGEPIVCTPQDAYRCFMASEMDMLVLENCVLRRTEQPQQSAEARKQYIESFELD